MLNHYLIDEDFKPPYDGGFKEIMAITCAYDPSRFTCFVNFMTFVEDHDVL